MHKREEPLNILIHALFNELSFCCIEQIDEGATFGVGHCQELPDNGYDDLGRVIAQGYIDLDLQDIQKLLYDEYVTGVKVKGRWLEFEDGGMHLTEKAIRSYVLGNFFYSCDSQLAAICFDLMVAAKWDTAIREAMLLVETRLKNLSGSVKWGVDLVNECFGQKGILASKFKTDSERQGFRDLFAGAMQVIRNDYAHNFREPSRQEAIATIQFADMLLGKLSAIK